MQCTELTTSMYVFVLLCLIWNDNLICPTLVSIVCISISFPFILSLVHGQPSFYSAVSRVSSSYEYATSDNVNCSDSMILPGYQTIDSASISKFQHLASLASGASVTYFKFSPLAFAWLACGASVALGRLSGFQYYLPIVWSLVLTESILHDTELLLPLDTTRGPAPVSGGQWRRRRKWAIVILQSEHNTSGQYHNYSPLLLCSNWFISPPECLIQYQSNIFTLSIIWANWDRYLMQYFEWFAQCSLW